MLASSSQGRTDAAPVDRPTMQNSAIQATPSVTRTNVNAMD